jgi:hypothetical protein
VAVSGIGAGNDESAQGIERPVRNRALSELVVARVFMQGAREDGAVALAVNSPALSPGWGRILGLIDGGEGPIERKSEIVEDSGGGDAKFLVGWKSARE